VLAVSSYLIRKIPDPFGIAWEISRALVFAGIPAVVFLALGSGASNAANFTFNQATRPLIYLMVSFQSWLQAYIYFKQKRAYLAMAQENNKIKNRDSNAQAMWAGFAQVLVDPTLHEHFERHLTHEHAVESLHFYDATTEWRRNFSDSPQRTLDTRARKIIGLYIGESSPFPVNLSYDTTIELLRVADDRSTPIPREVFDLALRQIKDLLQRDAYLRFIMSKEYATCPVKVDANVVKDTQVVPVSS